MNLSVPVILASAGTGLPRPETNPPLRQDEDTAKVAEQFEALIVGQLLKSARAASLADDPLTGSGGAAFTDLIDAARAQALAKATPLGVARLLAK